MSKASSLPPFTTDAPVEKLFARETEALRKAETTLTQQQLSDVVYEPFRELVKHHRRLLRQAMKLTTLSDATQLQLRRTTRELSTALEQVRQLNESLQTLQREREEIFAMAVHDLKSPLSGIHGLAALISDPELSTAAEHPAMGRDIGQLAEVMLATVADLVDLHRYEAGTVALRPAHHAVIDLGELLRAQLLPAARRKHIKLTLITRPPDASVYLDADALLRVVLNLATNALKFSPAGTAVELKLKVDAGLLHATVTDQGPGISADDQKKLFKKFARLAARPTGGEGSSGLGLAIVKRLVEIQSGRVWCESTLGAGAAFHVELPAAPSA
jgi:signal transduction histidine kinase